jgi:hypothetical protein
MKDKVVRKRQTHSSKTSNDEHIIPSNLLISPSQSINSTSSSSASTFLTSSINHQQQPPTTLQTALVSLTSNSTFVSSNNNSSFISSNNNSSFISSNNNPLHVSPNGPAIFSLPTPVQQTIINDDIPLLLDTASYVDPQPASSSVIAQSSSPQQTNLIEKKETNKNRQDSMDTCRILSAFH